MPNIQLDSGASGRSCPERVNARSAAICTRSSASCTSRASARAKRRSRGSSATSASRSAWGAALMPVLRSWMPFSSISSLRGHVQLWCFHAQASSDSAARDRLVGRRAGDAADGAAAAAACRHAAGSSGERAARHREVGRGAPHADGAERSATRIGLIDSGVDVTHEVFNGITVQQHGCGTAVPAEHGTAVASLMVGRASTFHGAAPGSALYAADVFCGRPTGGAVDAVAEAFGWLAREHVPVINVSLVGPPNTMLAAIVQDVLSRGYLIVAAVGNDGPAAPPLYPAAWPGVIGVTAVDARQRVLVEAGRGPQVKFAAPGADMAAASPQQAYVLVRGTSFASPIVAGLLALELEAPDGAAAKRAVAALAARALHPGAPGLEPVYGYGLVGAELRQQPALARVRPD